MSGFLEDWLEDPGHAQACRCHPVPLKCPCSHLPSTFFSGLPRWIPHPHPACFFIHNLQAVRNSPLSLGHRCTPSGLKWFCGIREQFFVLLYPVLHPRIVSRSGMGDWSHLWHLQFQVMGNDGKKTLEIAILKPYPLILENVSISFFKSFSLWFKTFKIHFTCMCVLPACLCTTCMPAVHRYQKKVLNPLDLHLGNCEPLCGCWKWTESSLYKG